jgi:hypothetical protein
VRQRRDVIITTPITPDDRKNDASEFYVRARSTASIYLRAGKMSIADAIHQADLTLHELKVLLEQGYITVEQFHQGRPLIKQRMQQLKAARRAEFDAAGSTTHQVDECLVTGGTCAASRWLKAGDRITCYTNNLHYVPAQLNQLSIDKPYHYRFQVVPRNAIADWSGAILDSSVLNWLMPGNTMRCCFAVIDTKTNQGIAGGAWYFSIVSIDSDRVLGEVLDTYYSPAQFGLAQQFGNYVSFFKRNISEIPLGWSDNLKAFSKIKYGFGFAVSGAREETQQHDVTH